ncbi:MAG: holin family protein [Dehalococcoidia bacterium]|jgi:hypothetical protein
MGLDITGLGSIFDFASRVIDKIFPDKDAADRAKLEMLKVQQAGQFKELEMEWDAMKAQIAVNAKEAEHPSVFVSGWRPAVGWVCVGAYAFNYLLLPLMNWLAKWHDPMVPPILALDTGELTTLLFGMLGIGGLRTYEKIKGATK